MNKKDKEKNILDHEFDTQVNYLNVIAAFGAASIFSVIIALASNQLTDLDFAIIVVLSVIAIAAILLRKTKRKMENIKVQIMDL